MYNAQSCGECHQNPTTGGISQITELRAGHFNGVSFINHPGGSLINDRAINANFQERVLGGNEVRTFRTSLNTLGDGFVEAIANSTLHNVGTGDGIVQNGGQRTRNMVRTPPLWGMRSRDRLMHDGNTVNRNEAILRHAGQATGVINNYLSLSTTQKNKLITFLNSL